MAKKESMTFTFSGKSIKIFELYLSSMALILKLHCLCWLQECTSQLFLSFLKFAVVDDTKMIFGRTGWRLVVGLKSPLLIQGVLKTRGECIPDVPKKAGLYFFNSLPQHQKQHWWIWNIVIADIFIDILNSLELIFLQPNLYLIKS